jgi:hypothetical protein
VRDILAELDLQNLVVRHDGGTVDPDPRYGAGSRMAAVGFCTGYLTLPRKEKKGPIQILNFNYFL